jgi:hypothetical protein
MDDSEQDRERRVREWNDAKARAHELLSPRREEPPAQVVDPFDAWCAERPAPDQVREWLARCPEPMSRPPQPKPEPDDPHKALRQAIQRLETEVRELRAELASVRAEAGGNLNAALNEIARETGALVAQVENRLSRAIKRRPPKGAAT